MTAAVLGAGSWGTTLAILLAGRGHAVRLWARSAGLAAAVRAAGENAAYLPGVPVGAGVEVTDRLEHAVESAQMVFVAVPVQHIRAALEPARPWVRAAIRVGAAKGIERITLMRVSEIVGDIWGPGEHAVLSGPSFALEVARGEPTAVTVASARRETAEVVQREVATQHMRIYTSDDVAGVELAGALKNVMAIAAGIAQGLGLGANARAALLTRGLAEMSRLGVALGGQPATFLGLAGVGDLLLTGTGPLSRNLRLGEAIGRGATLAAAQEGRRSVAEGVDTATSALGLASRAGVEMPITREVVRVLFEGASAHSAIQRLMGRDLRAE